MVANPDGVGPTMAVTHERFAGRVGYGGSLVAEHWSTEAVAGEDDSDWRAGVSVFGRGYLVRKTTERWYAADRGRMRPRACTDADKLCVRKRTERYGVALGLRLDAIYAMDDGFVPVAAPELHARYDLGPLFAAAEAGYQLETEDPGPYARVLVGFSLYLDVGYPTPQWQGRRLPNMPEP